MKRLLWGIFTAVATLAVLLVVGLLLVDREPDALPVREETVAAVPAETLPAVTETLPG